MSNGKGKDDEAAPAGLDSTPTSVTLSKCSLTYVRLGNSGHRTPASTLGNRLSCTVSAPFTPPPHNEAGPAAGLLTTAPRRRSIERTAPCLLSDCLTEKRSASPRTTS